PRRPRQRWVRPDRLLRPLEVVPRFAPLPLDPGQLPALVTQECQAAAKMVIRPFVFPFDIWGGHLRHLPPAIDPVLPLGPPHPPQRARAGLTQGRRCPPRSRPPRATKPLA